MGVLAFFHYIQVKVSYWTESNPHFRHGYETVKIQATYVYILTNVFPNLFTYISDPYYFKINTLFYEIRHKENNRILVTSSLSK